MDTIYVNVTVKLALKMNDREDYDDVAADLEERITEAVEGVSTPGATVEVLEGAALTVTDSK